MKPALAEASGALGSFSLGLSGVIGLAAILLLVARLTHFWAGVGAVLVAGTAPVFYVHQPSGAAGDSAWIPTAAAVTALALAALGPGSRTTRGCAIALGVVALGFGYHRSGAMVGVFLPAASVALSWAFAQRPSASCPKSVPDGLPCTGGTSSTSGETRRGLRFSPVSEGRAAAWLAGAAGGGALVFEALGAFTSVADAHRALAIVARSARRSFDFPLAALGRDFFPWSALLPASLAAMSTLPLSSLRAGAATLERQSALRVLLLTGTALSYAASALPTARPQPFAGLIFVAGAVGVWLWDVGRGARLRRPALAVSALLVTLLGIDFLRLPQARALTFAPGATSASQLGAPSGPSGPGEAAFVAAVLLMWAGLAHGALWDSRRARRRCAGLARRVGLRGTAASAGRPRVLLFAGVLLAALVIRCADDPAASKLRPSTATEGG